ncbi:PEP-CTERM sorting domain-containing protein [Tolypothrix sp. PCC 7910]|uniref:exosortase-dependent surface protein XDP2 n=1 Tax=Tolypothrix sp. PCC 7910 TaxID=2099387 RepID=UPI0014279ED3|nr:exosortase-dependent surface protein XDP2 [Tolypothrix sp. PCC 7910]QIR39623.1 PEP-CTERM sorting domain-containing protein [Tolypothrix sp. PCC 7910]
MKIHSIPIFVFLSFGTLLAFSPAVKAATFQSNFTTALTGTDASKGDILLNSITQNGIKFSNFNFVTSASILENDVYTGGNTGAASTDKGDKANSPFLTQEDLKAGNASDGAKVAAFLGNNNLNNIIDTEDTGKFKINLKFASNITQDNTGLDNLFFWERGKNSKLTIQALDANNTIIGRAITLDSATFGDAGFKIDTMEIGGEQQVGSWGVKLQELGVSSLSGLQLTADKSFNGPDFKLLARSSQISSEKVPEPSTTASLGFLAVIAAGLLRNKPKFLV